ncbi:MAG: hypothetical protein FWG90_00400 [Oscillospiraceae bacterium]|nr:hypothetical protein [Oscillospiraceae bacterium]
MPRKNTLLTATVLSAGLLICSCTQSENQNSGDNIESDITETAVVLSEKISSSLQTTSAEAEEPLFLIAEEKTYSKETEEIIADFLSDYLTIFIDIPINGYRDYINNGRDNYISLYDPITDKTISEAVYIWGNAYAVSFDLYALDTDDAPIIIINYGNYGYCGSKVYKYIDSKYTEIGRLDTVIYSFYTDKNENFVLRYDDDMNAVRGLYYASFNNTELELDVIVDGDYHGNLYNYITDTVFGLSEYLESYDNLLIPGMSDEPLIRINNLSLLEEHITELVAQKLKNKTATTQEYSVEPVLLSRLGITLGDLKEQIGYAEPQFQTHAEYYLYLDTDIVLYFFQGDVDQDNGSWLYSDTHICEKISAPLGRLVFALNEPISIADLADKLNAEYEIKRGHPTSYYLTSQEYAVLKLPGNSARLEIAFDVNDNMAKSDSRCWLRLPCPEED